MISSGTTDTVLSTDYVIAWNSATASVKSETLPACSSAISGRILKIKDAAKTSLNYNITLTPSSGTIEGFTSYPINYNGQSLEMQCDGSSNWMVM